MVKDELDGRPDALRVLGLAGSLRAASYNRALLCAARELAPSGMAIESFDRLGELPHFDQDLETRGDPEPVAALKTAVRGADALLIVTPEYNYGMPGMLKNAIDWASRPPRGSVLQNKPAAIMGASPGNGGTARAQLQLRQAFVFTQTYALPGPEVLISRARERFDAELRLTDERVREAVRALLARLAEWTRRLHGVREPG